jgi:hypothetical protein
LGLRGGGADAHLAERDGWCLGRWAARRLLMLSPSSVSSSSPVPTPQSLFFFWTLSPVPTQPSTQDARNHRRPDGGGAAVFGRTATVRRGHVPGEGVKDGGAAGGPTSRGAAETTMHGCDL